MAFPADLYERRELKIKKKCRPDTYLTKTAPAKY